MLILSEIWVKTIFKSDPKKVALPERLIFLNILSKKRLFQSDLKITKTFSKHEKLRTYLQKTIFSKRFLKKRPFLRNIDIYGFTNEKRIFPNELQKLSLPRSVDI